MKKLILSLILPLLAVGIFTACDDVPSPYYVLSPEEIDMTMEGEGKAEKPYTVNDALKIISAGTYSSSKVYLEGVVVQIDDIDDDQFNRYHNLTYYIADEKDIAEDGSVKQQIEVYRGMGLAGANFATKNDLKVGDHVIVWGQLTLYGSTAEVTQGSWLYKLNDQTAGKFDSDEEPAGSGTFEDPYNVARANNLIETGEFTKGKKVYVKGIVSRVDDVEDSEFARFHNLTYYISDDGTAAGQLAVYRGMGLGGANFEKKDDLKVGDEVIVYGELTLYGSTKEITQGSQLAYLNGQESKPSDPTSGEATGDGTKENPYNSVAANQLANSLADNATSDVVYIKGKVASIKENYDSKNPNTGQYYGNATFYISDDGSSNGQFYIYRALYLGNKEYDGNGDLLNVGDDVIICGKVTKFVNNYGTTLESVQKEAYLYSLNGKVVEGGNTQPSGEATGDGTQQNPYNCVAAINVCNALAADTKTDKDVYVKGTIVSIKENYNKTDDKGNPYGNITCFISDDGTTTNQFQIYRALYFGNQPWTEGVMPKVGDDVVFCGKLMNFRGNTPETSQKEAYLYSLNGQTQDGNDPDPGPETPGLQGKGTMESPYSVADAQQVYEKAGGIGSATTAYVTGYVVGHVNGNSYNESTVTFGYPEKAETEIVIADSPDETDYLKCIPVQLPKDGEWRTQLELFAQQSLLGQQVLLYGTITDYYKVCGIKPPTFARWGNIVIGEASAKRR